jgi:hypothetical protein
MFLRCQTPKDESLVLTHDFAKECNVSNCPGVMDWETYLYGHQHEMAEITLIIQSSSGSSRLL